MLWTNPRLASIKRARAASPTAPPSRIWYANACSCSRLSNAGSSGPSRFRSSADSSSSTRASSISASVSLNRDGFTLVGILVLLLFFSVISLASCWLVFAARFLHGIEFAPNGRNGPVMLVSDLASPFDHRGSRASSQRFFELLAAFRCPSKMLPPLRILHSGLIDRHGFPDRGQEACLHLRRAHRSGHRWRGNFF